MLLKRQPRGDAVHQNKDKIVKFWVNQDIGTIFGIIASTEELDKETVSFFIHLN